MTCIPWVVLSFSFQSLSICPRYISTSFCHPDTFYGRILHTVPSPAQCHATGTSTEQTQHWMTRNQPGRPFHPSHPANRWLELPCQLTSDAHPSCQDVNNYCLHLRSEQHINFSNSLIMRSTKKLGCRRQKQKWKNQPITRQGIEYCSWFILLLVLPAESDNLVFIAVHLGCKQQS